MYDENVSTVLTVSKNIKITNNKIKIFYGGPHASNSYYEILRTYSYVDYIIIGEGELPIYNLILTLMEKKSFSKLKGVCYRDSDGIIISSEHCIIKDLDSILDALFTFDCDRVFEIAKSINRYNNTMTFSFSSRIEFIINNKDKLSELKKLGLTSIELGVENFSDKILKFYNKGTDLNKVLQAIEILKINKINIDLDFILFCPILEFQDLKLNIFYLVKEGFVNKNYYNSIFSTLEFFTGTKMRQIYGDDKYHYEKINIYENFNDHKVSLVYELLMMFRKLYLESIEYYINNIKSKEFIVNIIIKKVEALPFEFLITSVNYIDKSFLSNIPTKDINIDDIFKIIIKNINLNNIFFILDKILKGDSITSDILLISNLFYNRLDMCYDNNICHLFDDFTN